MIWSGRERNVSNPFEGPKRSNGPLIWRVANKREGLSPAVNWPMCQTIMRSLPGGP